MTDTLTTVTTEISDTMQLSLQTSQLNDQFYKVNLYSEVDSLAISFDMETTQEPNLEAVFTYLLSAVTISNQSLQESGQTELKYKSMVDLRSRFYRFVGKDFFDRLAALN